jgi:hypothetical protein
MTGRQSSSWALLVQPLVVQPVHYAQLRPPARACSYAMYHKPHPLGAAPSPSGDVASPIGAPNPEPRPTMHQSHHHHVTMHSY